MITNLLGLEIVASLLHPLNVSVLGIVNMQDVLLYLIFMSLFHSMCKYVIQSDDHMNYMKYMKPSDKSINNTQVYNCGQLVAPL